MPVKITRDTDTGFEEVAWLCGDEWELPSQLDALETWLMSMQGKLHPDSYVADVGFDIRSDASGGGAAVSAQTLRFMGELGMELHLSEYPGCGSAA